MRLTKLINPIEAMTMMLTGRAARARRAKSIGLVDAVTSERHVRAAVNAAIAGDLKTSRSNLLGRVFAFAPARGLAGKRMRAQARTKAPPDHYPAPGALIDLWEAHGGNAQAMQKAEIASFSQLVVSSTARNLIRVFFLREKLKSLADGTWTGRRVHVIGAGAMGGDIAAWCAWHGFTVTLADMKAEPLAGAMKRAAALYGKIARQKIDVRDALDRLIPDLKGEGARTADLVIEAVPENLALKQKVYAGIEPQNAAARRFWRPTRPASRWSSCVRVCSVPSACSACISSIRSHACNWSRWSVTTRSRLRSCRRGAPFWVTSTGSRRRSRALRASSSTVR